MAYSITSFRRIKHITLTTIFAVLLILSGIGCSRQAEATQDKGNSGLSEKKDSQPDVGKKSIDAATIAAYKELGAVYRVEGLPIFQFKTFPKSKLPDVSVPFGLDLTDSDVSDHGLKELAGLKNLTVLSLNGARKVTDAGLKELAIHKTITQLHLSGTKVTNAGLKELAALTNLTSLRLDGTQVTDEGLKHLASLTNLTYLHLAWDNVTNAGLKELTPLTRLESLFLHGTKVTDEGLRELVPLSKLASLYLPGTKVTDSGLKHLEQIKSLAFLDLRDTLTTEVGVANLQKALPHLQAEHLRPSPPLTKAIDLLFPLEGVTLGKTTVAELEKLGKRDRNSPDNDKYVVVKGINFWHHNTNVAYNLYMTKHDNVKLPASWQKVGFDYGLSYDGWLKLFANLGWKVDVVVQPKVVKHDFQQHSSLQAEIEVTSGDIKLKLRFDYGEGVTTAASGTLYTLAVTTKQLPVQVAPRDVVPPPNLDQATEQRIANLLKDPVYGELNQRIYKILKGNTTPSKIELDIRQCNILATKAGYSQAKVIELLQASQEQLRRQGSPDALAVNITMEAIAFDIAQKQLNRK